MVPAVCRLLSTVIFVILTVSAALAEKRVALVIGNSAYQNVEKLKNPSNDATKLARKLRTIGFDKVTLKLDLSYSALRRTLGRFARDAAGADIALVYFAGHGIEVGGTNYVIPTDASLAHVDDVDLEAIELSTFMRVLNRASKLKLVILDACRNNPFRAGMSSQGVTRSIGRGLARVSPAGSDTLVAYAAREGTVAADGDGAHSPYAAALIKHIATPGLDVRLLFGRVRDEVMKSTGGKQEPFTYGSLAGNRIMLVDGAAADTAGGGSAAADNSLRDELAKLKAKVQTATNAQKRIDELKEQLAQQQKTLAELREQRQKQQKLAALEKKPDPKPAEPSAEEMNRRGFAAYEKKNYAEAVRWYRKAAEKGNAYAMGNLARRYYAGTGVRQDYYEAFKWFMKSAEAGITESIVSVGWMYSQGQGVTKDNQQAVYWSRKGADKKHPYALANLGLHYRDGTGVKRDYREALRLFRESAKLKHPRAMFLVGGMYENGRGVRKSVKTAVSWYEKAVKAGHKGAMIDLGNILVGNRGVKADYSRAARLYKDAAGSDYPVAWANLGYLYAAGLGVSKSPDYAASLISRAIKAGDEHALNQMLTNSGQWGRPFRRSMQKKMRNEGVYTGPIDGSFGSGTKQALRRLAGRS